MTSGERQDLEQLLKLAIRQRVLKVKSASGDDSIVNICIEGDNIILKTLMWDQVVDEGMQQITGVKD